MAQPDISDIPAYATMQANLANVDAAIAALGTGGAVATIIIAPKQDVGVAIAPMAIRVDLNPPATDDATITQITSVLQTQSEAITTALTAAGFTNAQGA